MALTKIGTDGVKDDAITSGKIPANAVGSSELADNAVDTNAIANDAVTGAKINANAVGTTQLLNESVTLAKLEHGTSSNDGKFLRANNGADPSFETVSIPAGTTINNNADNRVITGSGTANTLEGEANLTWDATTLKAEAANPILELSGTAGTSGNTFMHINANANHWCVGADNYSSQNLFVIKSGTPASSTHKFAINSSGEVGINVTNPEAYGANGHGYGGLTVQAPSGSYSGITIRSGYNGGGALFFADGSAGDAERRNLGFASDHVNKRLNWIVEGSTVARFTEHGFHPNPASPSASTALDDYEEGTFTPSFFRSSNNPSASFYTRHGYYVKVGQLVHIQFLIDAYNVSGGSGIWGMGNFPFNTANINIGWNNPATMSRVYLDQDMAKGVDGVTMVAAHNQNYWWAKNADDDTWCQGNFSRVIFQGCVTYRASA